MRQPPIASRSCDARRRRPRRWPATRSVPPRRRRGRRPTRARPPNVPRRAGSRPSRISRASSEERAAAEARLRELQGDAPPAPTPTPAPGKGHAPRHRAPSPPLTRGGGVRRCSARSRGSRQSRVSVQRSTFGVPLDGRHVASGRQSQPSSTRVAPATSWRRGAASASASCALHARAQTSRSSRCKRIQSAARIAEVNRPKVTVARSVARRRLQRE